jgi:hypothetical protein
MAIQVITGTISTDSDSELLTFGNNVIQAWTDNPLVFVLPDPTIPVLTGLRDDFKAGMEAADGGGEADTATKNNLRRLYENGLRLGAAFVQKTANAANGGNGDVSVVYLGGFQPHKVAQPKGVLGAPGNLRLKQAQLTGELACRAEAVDGAASYEWRYALQSAPTAWLTVNDTTAPRTVIKRLTAGTIYTVQVRAIGFAGPSDWSDPAMLMVT